MAFILGALPNSHWEKVIPILTKLGWPEKQTKEVETWYLDDKELESSVNSHKYLLLHARPELIVAETMRENSCPKFALEQWKKSVQLLLAVYKRNRKNTLLIEVEGVLDNPQLFADSICSHFDLELDCEDFSCISKVGELDLECLLMANQLVTQQEDICGMLLELQACTLPLKDSSFCAPKLDIFELYQQYRVERERSFSVTSTIKNIEKENSMLIAQLHQTQEKLEEYYFKAKADSNEVKNLTNSLEQVKKDFSRVKEKIESIRRSTSWRLTGPMRVLKRSLYIKRRF